MIILLSLFVEDLKVSPLSRQSLKVTYPKMHPFLDF